MAAGGGGALADIGSHIFETARHLVGPISWLMADVETLIPMRPIRQGETQFRAVEVDDVARIFVKFANGASGTLEANWTATGRKMQHEFEIYGSKGAILFTQERLNELKIYYTDDQVDRRGFRTVFAGPEHEPYGAFCVAPSHQIGFNDLKAIEVRDLYYSRRWRAAIAKDLTFARGTRFRSLLNWRTAPPGRNAGWRF
jgi:predicted dehydrogenase